VDGVHYLTMAYIDGQSLARYVENHAALSQRAIAVIVLKLARALRAAHEKDVIHRDLKPSNVMMHQSGGAPEPVIVDFGLAQRLESDAARLTKSGHMVGTWAYMTPEQLCGEKGAGGPSCDIYALGVILYELLTGRVPFELPGQVVASEPDLPSMYREDLDARLEEICLKAMAKKKSDRHATMTDLAKALSDYLKSDAEQPAATPKPESTTRVLRANVPEPARTKRREKKGVPAAVWGGVAVGLLLCVALAAGALVLSRRGARQTTAIGEKTPEDDSKNWRTKEFSRSVFESALADIKAGKLSEAQLKLTQYLGDLQAPNRDEAILLRDAIQTASGSDHAKEVAKSLGDAQLKDYLAKGVEELAAKEIKHPEVRQAYAKTLLAAFRAETDFRAKRVLAQELIGPTIIANARKQAALRGLGAPNPNAETPAPAFTLAPPPDWSPEDGVTPLAPGETLDLWRDPAQLVRRHEGQLVSNGADGLLVTRKTYNLGVFQFDYAAEPDPTAPQTKRREGRAAALARIQMDQPMTFFGSRDPVSRIELALTSEEAGKVFLLDRRNNRVATSAAATSVRDPEPARWHHAEIRCEDGSIRFAIDNAEVNSLKLDRAISAFVGFHFVTGRTHVANLRVSEQRSPTVAKRLQVPQGARPFNGKHFMVIKRSATWLQAKEMCRTMDGHLAVITDEAENRFVSDLLKAAGLKSAWIGATDVDTEGDWIWVDGTRVKYTNWDRARGQPDDEFGLDDYALLNATADGNGTWSDERVELPRPFICQWDR
jgi:hypothetical protein